MLRIILLVLAVAVQQGLSYRSVCYHTNWSQYRNGKGKFTPDNIDANLCTHIIYAFATVTGANLKPFEWNDESTAWSTGMYERAMNLKAKNPSLKILVGVGGWNMGSAPFTAIVNTASHRQLFAKNIVTFLRKHNFDGLDNDWEYPGSRGSPPEDKQNNVLFMEELRRAMDADAQATGRSRLLLTTAIGAGKATIDKGYDFPGLARSVDWFNVMSYDLHGTWESETGHHSPLYPDPSEIGDELHLNVDWVTAYMVSQGMPKDKLVLGIPTYGRSFTLTDASNHGLGAPATKGVKGRYTGEAGFLSYYEICDMIKAGAQVYDIEGQHAKYLVHNNQWVGYENVDTVKAKACYAKQHDFGGVMFWALPLDDFGGSSCGQGRFPLIKAASQEFKSADKSSCSMSTGGSQTHAPILPTSGPVKPQTPAPYTPGPQTPMPTSDHKSPCATVERGFFPHPTDCHSYISCNYNHEYIMTCPPTLVFNPASKGCDYPRNVPSCASWKGFDLDNVQSRCKDGDTGLLPHLTDCHKFIQCSYGREWESTCPGGLVFNPQTNNCDRLINVPSCQ